MISKHVCVLLIFHATIMQAQNEENTSITQLVLHTFVGTVPKLVNLHGSPFASKLIKPKNCREMQYTMSQERTIHVIIIIILVTHDNNSINKIINNTNNDNKYTGYKFHFQN